MTLAPEVAATLPRALESYPDQSSLSLYQLLIEVVFGLWAIVLLIAMGLYAGWETATHYFK